MALKEICGCVHLHTTFSDGECGYDEFICAAKNAALDYICVTDHMNLGGRGTEWEGLRGSLLVHTGYEHEDDGNKNHYLALGVSEVAAGQADPQEYINNIKNMGGAGFIAHPNECRCAMKGLPPPYPWTRWDVTGFNGIEIWNQVSDWIEHLDRLRQNPLRMSLRLFFPNRFLRNAPKELLAKWDEMNLTRFVSAIGGVDAHNRKIKIGPFTYVIFPINVELRGIRTHLFADEAVWKIPADGKADSIDAERMNRALVDAMRNGRGFISNYSRGDARGCKIFLSDNNGAIQYPGLWKDAQPPLSLPLTMNVKLTRKAKIMLIRNGKVIK
ncbi:MAG: PHP domain-containing protein, partial [Chitinispirillia bacterium]|nr:PHP domain-containing protein [Chitinispirillia bacterium]